MNRDDDVIDFNENEAQDIETEESDTNGKKNKKKKGWKGHVIRLVIAIVILAILYLTAVYSNIPFIKKWRTIYIETAMSTMTHQWLATAFIPHSVIEEVMEEVRANREAQKELESKWEQETQVTEVTEETEQINPEDEFFAKFWELDTDSVREYLASDPAAANGYTEVYVEDLDEKLGLTTVNGHSVLAIDQKNNAIIIAVHGKKFEGKLALVKDPAQVQLKKSSNGAKRGDLISEFGENNNALVAINASGFRDPGGHGNGGEVAGCMIIDGVDYGKSFSKNRKFYGMKFDNKLYIDNYWTIDVSEYKWGVQFQPALIVNGESVVDGSFGMGIQPRTTVGQAQDGTFMMYIVDGRQPGYSLGCTVADCADLLKSYGAVQAANFDGGSSSIMWYNGKQITKPSSVSKVGRYLPDALVIMRAGE